MTDHTGTDHTAALCATYGITVTQIRRNPPETRYLAEQRLDDTTRTAYGATEAAAVTALVARLRSSLTTRTPNT